MRKILACLPLLMLGLIGCNLPQREPCVGWHLAVYKPSIGSSETPTLYQVSAASMGAVPQASVAGPVSEGQFSHAPSVPVPMPSGPTKPDVKPGVSTRIGPCGETRLTIEEFKSLMSDCKGTR